MVDTVDHDDDVPLEILLGDIDDLRPHLLTRRGDLDAERYQDRTHIYAIDTNVLYFCAQPLAYVRSAGGRDPKKSFSWQRGVRSGAQRMVDLGSVFRSDPLELQGVICTALAHYIGFELGRGPLYIPRSIEAEIEGMFAHFASFSDELTGFDSNLLGNIADRLNAAIGGRFTNEQMKAIEADVPALGKHLERLLNARAGPAGGLARLDQMYEGGRISKLSWINPLRMSRHVYNSFSEIEDDQTRVIKVLSEAWDRDLIAAGKDEERARRADARALAEVEFWNQAVDSGDGRRRLLYVTADKIVHFAAARRKHGNGSFAAHYVRHPSAFLQDIIVAVQSPMLDLQERTPPTSLLDWVDLLISGYVDSRTTNYTAGSGLSKKALQQIHSFGLKHPDESVKVRKSWHSLADLREGRLIEELGLGRLMDEFVERVASASDGLVAGQLLDELRKDVLAEEAKAWESCFKIAAELTLKAERSHIEIPARSSPPICFEEWHRAGEAVEQFKFWGYNEPFDGPTFSRFREQLIANDNTRYAYYLAFASLFAGRGNWKAAAALSSFAYELAQFSGRAQGAGSNGREAAFLEAVARRHLATNSRQLERSDEALNACWSILDWEGNHQGVSPETVVSERFELEELDSRQTRLLFDLGIPSSLPFDDDKMRKAAHLVEEYSVIQRRIERRLSTFREMSFGLGGRDNILLQTELRSIVSACSLFVLGLDRDPETTIKISCLVTRVDNIDQILRDGQSVKRLRMLETSFFSKVVLGVSRVLLTAGKRRPSESDDISRLRDLRRMFSRAGIKRNSVFPFDQDRFEYMRSLLNPQGR